MPSFKLDPSEKGLRKVLKEYQEIALRVLWEKGDEGAGSRRVYEETNNRLAEGKSISRASIIFFLDDMVEQGVLSYHEETGKGGYHRIYTPEMTESEYVKHLVKTVVESMIRDYPTETREALNKLIRPHE